MKERIEQGSLDGLARLGWDGRAIGRVDAAYC